MKKSNKRLLLFTLAFLYSYVVFFYIKNGYILVPSRLHFFSNWTPFYKIAGLFGVLTVGAILTNLYSVVNLKNEDNFEAKYFYNTLKWRSIIAVVIFAITACILEFQGK